MQKVFSQQANRHLPIGAEISDDGSVHFRVWAPKRRRVELLLVRAGSNPNDAQRLALVAEDDGYFSIVVEAHAGMRYGYRLDDQQRIYSDPASRFQPDGPAGLSQIIDPRSFAWTDQSWPGVSPLGQVLYEMHLGTFTAEGTFDAAAKELAELKRVGITVIELMPVADFPGRFGWGYDGVSMFAPTRLYGTPDDFRRFVDQAHGLGIGVILDVVYNHFGNVDNYTGEFSNDYKTHCYSNEWADAINFDGENSGPVREFFESNARYWIEEFHLDGFRYDATQSIHDASADHILAAVNRAARHAAPDRQLYLVAENEPEDVQHVRPIEEGGFGMDALWNDDFHHAAHVRLTGTNPAYYSDFLGNVEELAAAIKRGFIYQGQISAWQKKRRGTPTAGLPATAFVTFLENHDQVSNSPTAQRLYQLTSPGRYRAMTALWLLAPQTPLFFQGQEFGASTPFLYFADFRGEMAKNVTRGRAEFMSQFPSVAGEEGRRKLHNPCEWAAFERSKLNFAERESNRAMYDLHVDLLRLRREDAVFKLQRSDLVDTAILSPDCLAVRYFGQDGDDRLLVVNFGLDVRLSPIAEPLLAPPADRRWKKLWNSNSPQYGGPGEIAVEAENGWFISGESAIAMQAVGP
jgi:maltooligosyltrehalose trehalohydrolase